MACAATGQLMFSPFVIARGRIGTYKRYPAVRAPANLRLVDVDEDAWVAKRTAAAVARDLALFCPTHGLLVDEVDRGERAWLSLLRQSFTIH